MKKIIKILILLLIPAIVAASAFINKYKPDLIKKYFQSVEVSRNLYREARQAQLNSDFKTAYYTYGKISGKYKIYDIVLFHQGECAAAIEDEKTAIKKYAKLLSVFPKSPLAPIAGYNLGKAYMRHKNNEEAEKQFQRIIEKYPNTEFAVGSLYYLGELSKSKDKDATKEYWIKYIAIAPGGRFAMESIEGIKSLNCRLSHNDQFHIGIALYMQKQYRQALTYLDPLPKKLTWYYRAMCHKALNNRWTAGSIFKYGIANYMDEDMDISKVKNAMNAYINVSYSSRYRTWSHIVDTTKLARDFALYNKAQLLSLEKARTIYEEIYNKYPEGDYASFSLWQLLWYEYDHGNYDMALQLGEKHLVSYPDTYASPAVHFWIGKIYEKKNDNAKAKQFYKIVTNRFPDSYYAFRATGRINALKGKKDPQWETSPENKLPEVVLSPELPCTYDELVLSHGIHAAETVFLGDYETASMFMNNDPFVKSWIQLQKEELTTSIVTARKGMSAMKVKPGQKDCCWKLIYPVYYAEDINKNAVSNKLDPVIVISLMKEESHFNPFAVSSSNARGLMQVLPVTARDITKWKRLGTYRKSELFNPAVNIKVGTAYLGHTSDVFKKNMLYAVAAYNAGPTAVETWLKRIPHNDVDQFIENIPYNQTRTYVKKVFGSYWNYKRVYGLN